MRQYIGARYVPRFSDVNNGIWSNVYTYEPLTIVKNGNDYYTSKQSVPVGVAITNTEYWVKTGDYNGAIASLQERINEADIDIAELENRMTTGELNIAEIKEKHIVFVGDSYLASYENNWVTGFLQKFTPTSYQVIAAGGAAFSISSTPHFSNMLANATIEDSDKITDIILLAGTNDNLQSVSDIATGISQFVSVANTKCPNAKIHLGMIGLIRNGEQERQLRTKVLPLMKNATGCDYFAGIEFVNHNYTQLRSNDDRHPTDERNILIGNNAANIFMGLGCEYSEYNEATDVYNSYQSSSVSADVRSFVNNGWLDIKFNMSTTAVVNKTLTDIMLNNATTIQPNSFISLFTLNVTFTLAASSQLLRTDAPAMIRVYTSADKSTYVDMESYLYIEGASVSFITTNSEPLRYGFGFGVPPFEIKASLNCC